MKNLHICFLSLLALLGVMLPLTGCIEDGIETSPSSQPVFSADTLRIDDIFTGDPSVTHRFVVYNRHGRILNLQRIEFRNPEQKLFRINVDGRSGTSFDNVEIRPNDSIFVFVSVTLAPTEDWNTVNSEELLDFHVNGVRSSIVLAASGENVERLHGAIISSDTHWSGDHIRQIYDSLVVAPGATLTIGEGARLYLHDGAFIRVDGTLHSLGSPEAPVEMTGDRRGNVVGDISFDLMASQWQGVRFSASSHDNRMIHTLVKNTEWGVVVDSLAGADSDQPALDLLNCRLRNSAGYALEVNYSSLRAVGCELADASSGVLRLVGGEHEIAYSTIANYYLFSVLGGASVQFSHLGVEDEEIVSELPLMRARFSNCILWGNGSPLNYGDLTGSDVTFNRCLIKGEGSDDDNFVNILWDKEPLYLTDRSAYIFDYRLKPESPALGEADPSLNPAPPAVDPAGTLRPSPAAIGAYEVAPTDEE